MSAPYVKAEQVAIALGISKSAVYRMADRGEIPSYRYGRCLRFDLDEVRQSGRLHVGGAMESPNDVRDQARRQMVRDLPVQAPRHGMQHTIPPHDWNRDDQA